MYGCTTRVGAPALPVNRHHQQDHKTVIQFCQKIYYEQTKRRTKQTQNSLKPPHRSLCNMTKEGFCFALDALNNTTETLGSVKLTKFKFAVYDVLEIVDV